MLTKKITLSAWDQELSLLAPKVNLGWLHNNLFVRLYTTTDDTSTNIFTLDTMPNNTYLLLFCVVAIDTTNNKSAWFNGMIKITQE